ncbi:hypothetical protein F7725_025137 [Dissostichus mawsoni]|uniref:Proteasome assembly chaperone 2 n=1 Tax=Dissostichus mawsoni TaxID=36200 RepID=A0A7J5XAS4_DISMA|nr:hypothetical protein F7725_025137 [Dissostichus mawsoni]
MPNHQQATASEKVLTGRNENRTLINGIMFISSENSPPCFKDFTLVMPAVAVGNVGQLSVDLIVSTLNMSRVGYMHTDCLIPMTETTLYTAAELKLAVLQIRAPIIQSKSKKFRQLLVSWIKSSGFSRAVVLSSSQAYQRDDQQMKGIPLRYLVTPSLLKDSEDALKELSWREMERVSAYPEDVPLAVLILFCSEGDNIPDAFTLVNHLNDWLHLLDDPSQKWKIPTSWNLLFGSGIPPALF